MRKAGVTISFLLVLMTLPIVGCGGGNNKIGDNKITDMALMEFRDALITSTKGCRQYHSWS